jgi:hypothetical protein
VPEPTVDKPLVPPPEPAPSIEPVIKFTGAFATPESVLYDAAGDRYLVSNVNGKPGDADFNVTDNGPESTGEGQIFFIDKAGKVKVLSKSKELGGPNGLALGVTNTIVVNTLLGDEVYRLTEKGARDVVTKVPGGMLDGLVAIDDMLLVSSWKTETIYRGPLGGKFEPLITKVKGVADMGYDTKRKRLLVPRFLDDTVEVYELK